MKKILTVCIFSALILSVISCGKNKIPIETIAWEPDGEGFRQFKTNDIQYCEGAQWYYREDSYASSLSVIETKVKKVSGYENAGMGIVFGFQDHNNFYVFVINVNGEYAVFTRVDSIWSTIIDWPTSDSIIQGYNVVNTLKVTCDDPSDTFSLYINDDLVDSFTDSNFSDGSTGYECYIGDEYSDEIFPDEAADFRFKQTLPLSDP